MRFFQSTPMAIAAVDKNGRISRSNSLFARLFPAATQDAGNRSILAVVSDRDRAALEVGAELWARRGLKNGVATFGAGDDGLTPVHVPRDPMHLARAILAPFLGGPFA